MVCGLLSHSPLSTARDVCLGDRYRVTAETSYLSLRQAAAPMRKPLQWSACSAPPETHAKVRFGRGRNHRIDAAMKACTIRDAKPDPPCWESDRMNKPRHCVCREMQRGDVLWF